DARSALRQDAQDRLGRGRRHARGGAGRPARTAGLRGRARRRTVPLGRQREPRGAGRGHRARRPGRAPTAPSAMSGYTVTSLVDLERYPVDHGLEWRPIRRPLGIRAFGVNAYTAAKVGDWV